MNEDRSSRYHRLKRRATVASLSWTTALLMVLSGTGTSRAMRDLAERSAGSAPNDTVVASLIAVAVYTVLLTLCHEVGSLVTSAYGFELERRYGLAAQPWRGWFVDQMKGLALLVIFGIGAAEIIYAFIRAMPGIWWWPTGAVFTLLIVGLANLGPVLLMPLFYVVKPIERDALRARLLALASRAGAKVLGVYEWGLGNETRKANAALAGLGGTKRILVSDTMLSDYSDDEIEVVLAHELAHHVHGDIWKGLAFEGTLMLAGFFAASRVLPAVVLPLGLRDVSDVAGLPVLLLVAGALSLVLMPVAHAMSRAHERRADRFAIRLTRNPEAFVSAMRRLGAQNLAEEAPSRLVQWLFYSHPPFAERIEAARRLRP